MSLRAGGSPCPSWPLISRPCRFLEGRLAGSSQPLPAPDSLFLSQSTAKPRTTSIIPFPLTSLLPSSSKRGPSVPAGGKKGGGKRRKPRYPPRRSPPPSRKRTRRGEKRRKKRKKKKRKKENLRQRRPRRKRSLQSLRAKLVGRTRPLSWSPQANQRQG